MRMFVSGREKNEVVENGKIFYQKVLNARKKQKERYKNWDISYNSAIKEKHLPVLNIESSAYEIAKKYVENGSFSHRRLLKILAVARSIADYEECSSVHNTHVLESIFLCCKMNYGAEI